MRHFADSAFWNCHRKLPPDVRKLADKNFKLLKENPDHPSLRLKKVRKYWSVRIGMQYRALGIESEEGLVWFWIGTHAEYDSLVK